jgi:hypothetical protein
MKNQEIPNFHKISMVTFKHHNKLNVVLYTQKNFNEL